jgi:hypothetical protein
MADTIRAVCTVAKAAPNLHPATLEVALLAQIGQLVNLPRAALYEEAPGQYVCFRFCVRSQDHCGACQMSQCTG